MKASLKEPRKIDMNLVDAQQTRRILDRLVGYEISPLLWAKVKRGLSAGRVQSVALRIICDREDEINAFIPEEYWTLDAELSVKGERKTLLAKFYGDENGKLTISSKEQADRIMAEMQKEEFHVLEVKKRRTCEKRPHCHLQPVRCSRKHLRHLISQFQRLCGLHSSYTKVLMSKDREQLVLPLT